MLTEFEPRVDSPTIISTAALPSWQTELKDAVRSIAQLLEQLNLQETDLDQPALADADFPLRVPLSYVRRMGVGDPHDPLLRQVLPSGAELDPQPGFLDDPLAEREHAPAPGIVHKYSGRALVITTQACAVHCRYCFRQHFPYADNRLSPAQWQSALDYLASAEDLHEVIFSGGDPLSLPNDRLADLIADLARLPNLTTLRIHSRTPIVLPSRIDAGLLRLLKETRLKTVLVVHANHANEINGEVQHALAPLRQNGTLLLNQAVLLAGVNDSTEALTALSQALFSADVLPYYLHQLDPVRGAAHFDVPDDRAQQLWRTLQASLPGYLVPRLVREVPGDAGKRWLNQ
ncbi:EF-P beta-lysylation protein EpmB [Saccharospirillum sp. MSK14-1]|uniref:EF-P beta-lysylation protein EpmB n=1 Tax=Saccharospirillum sp. MSK14-1 TaxID=1897632 RepID=UPI000D3C5F12|nr:EF-P beta-lysylation protein EpmB [Saccharospirillum sp. MSK14-1]PTY38779.1 EF-P beta-lysylation protein EpmB [Saccharospirillum sp. MSK14-1]